MAPALSPAAARRRVVVADDSRFMARIICSALERAGFEVAGVAQDGDEALALCTRERPDVLSLDLTMPGLDGIGVLKALRERRMGIPVVVVSAFSPAHGARAVDALAEGAFELVSKPGVGEPLTRFGAELGEKMTMAVATRRRARVPRPPARVTPVAAPRPARALPSGGDRLVLIACSTGGPKALGELVPRLPAPLGAGTLIVQHMPPGFTGSLAARLDRSSPLRVREAAGSEGLDGATALLAPGGSHLRLAAVGRTTLSDEPAIGGLRPRADLTIRDAARLYGRRLLLVVLTGMGKDGLEGAREVRRRGGRVLVEAESSCTVYGMPRAVAEADLADAVLPLGDLPGAIAAEAAA